MPGAVRFERKVGVLRKSKLFYPGQESDLVLEENVFPGGCMRRRHVGYPIVRGTRVRSAFVQGS